MTWIRFGRNEPVAPSLPLNSNQGDALHLHRYRQDGPLVLFFTPPGGISGCGPLVVALTEAPLHEHEAELLLVSDDRRDLAAVGGAAVALDADGRLRSRYAALMDVDTAGKALLFLLDRDGSPVYAWVGGCDESQEVTGQLMQKLQSAAFLCPECSVPDASSAALWDVIY